MVRIRRPAERSPNLEDRRGRRAGVAVGAGGGLVLLVALLVTLLGGNPEDLGPILEQLAPAPQERAAPIDPKLDPQAELVDYMAVVLDDAQALWTEVFAASGDEYRPARLVIFEDLTESGCGGASAQVGPHYCPLDETVYLDLGFFEQLQARFGARGDFAPAYVLSHEIAHHVQGLLGVMEQVRVAQQQDPSQANELSISLELQADCLSGVWASTLTTASSEPIQLEAGDIREAIGAAEAVGDDRIQEQATGTVNRETWTHGSSEQRATWFETGYQNGEPARCDTFSGG